MSCNGDQFYSWDGETRELWGIKLVPDSVPLTSTKSSTPTTTNGGGSGYIATTVTGSATRPASSVIPTSTDTSASINTPVSTSIDSPDSVGGPSPNRVAVIAAGVVAGVGALCGLGVLAWFLRRRHNRHQMRIAGVTTAAYDNARMAMAMSNSPGPRFSILGFGFGATSDPTLVMSRGTSTTTQFTAPLATVPSKRWSDTFTSSSWAHSMFRGMDRPPSMHAPNTGETGRTSYLVDNFTLNLPPDLNTVPRRYYRDA